MSRSLQAWLDYQQTVHPRGVDLGLVRVGEVWQRLGAVRPAPIVITVAGTNGKGSTVAFLEAMLAAAGYRVGSYTSPHVLKYNERVRVAGVEATDAGLIAVFERIEAAREATALTYFEYSTLAALLLFADAGLDVAILEVGLGGRLDAVNLIDADVAIVTTIALDHQDWLGNDRDDIGREKAGVARHGRPLIIGETDPPAGLLAALAEIGADVIRAGIDYRIEPATPGWRWQSATQSLDFPIPQLAAPCQSANAAAAVAGLRALGQRLHVPVEALQHGVRNAQVAARLQRIAVGAGELIVDVAHNPQAAHTLAAWLTAHPSTHETLALFSALDDKDLVGIVSPLCTCMTEWHLVGLDRETSRGLGVDALNAALQTILPSQQRWVHTDVAAALDRLAARIHSGARVVAFGSFFVAAAALRWVAPENSQTG